MAMSPTTLLAKLDELKKWQQTQQERLMRQHQQRLDETDRGSSDYDSISGLSAYNSHTGLNDSELPTARTSFKINHKEREILSDDNDSNVALNCIPNSYDSARLNLNQVDTKSDRIHENGYSYKSKNSAENEFPLDKNKNISTVGNKASAINLNSMPLYDKPSPPEVFESGNSKPKRAFLKRGTGLGKFGMKPGDQRRPFNKMRPPETAVHKRLAALRKEEAANYKSNEEVKKIEGEKRSDNMKIVKNSDKEIRVNKRVQKNGNDEVRVNKGLEKNAGDVPKISNGEKNRDEGNDYVVLSKVKNYRTEDNCEINKNEHFSEKYVHANIDKSDGNQIDSLHSRTKFIDNQQPLSSLHFQYADPSHDQDFVENDKICSEIQGVENNTDLYTIPEELYAQPESRLNFDKFLSLKQSETNEITPLKVPQINVQTRAKWFSVDNNNELTEIQESANESLDIRTTNPVETGNLMECLKKLAEEKFGKNPNETAEIIKDFESLHLDETPDLHKKLAECLEQLLAGDNNSFAEKNKKLVIECLEELVGNCSDAETTSLRELHAFEQLERKVMNSSFCSTNSSILDLLSSTPFKKFVHEPKSVHFENLNPRRDSGAQRELDFCSHHSDESTVNSEDLNEPTLPRHRDFEETETTASTSSSSTIHERNVIVKQNACVMTDDLDFSAASQFGDEVLKKRLKELDLEIGKFRVENAKLQKLKEEVETERRELQKCRKKLEKEIQDERINMEFELEEQKKKLAKEKMVFEKYVKDLQNKPSKKEREEISALKAELANVKETLKLKETRNGTTQARLRTQLKSMEKENANSKEEIEKLQKLNAKLTAAQKVTRKTPSETKMLHEINKNLTKLTQDTKNGKSEKENSFEEKKRRRKKNDRYETEYRRSFGRCSDEDDSDAEKPERSRGKSDYSKEKRVQSPVDIPRRKSIEGKTIDSPDFYKIRKSLSRQSSIESSESYRNKSQRCSSSGKKNVSESDSSESDEISSRYTVKDKSYERRLNRTTSKTITSPKNADVTCGAVDKENDRNSTNCGDMTTFRNLSDLSIMNNYDKVFGQQSEKNRNNSMNDTQGSISGKSVTILEDGSKETKYSNGNVKNVSADGNFITMNYFNGDIKETKLSDGSIKYFYAQSELWHTTLSNGDEVFEFPDGQTEKRFINGTTEITFPNGVIKTNLGDGKEKIMYPDGSMVNVDGNEKVLHLPNGQKEIHTKEHKRREYPDGTVKILYPDGLQETRYSNGRIRMKDKDGNLIMDTHDDI